MTKPSASSSANWEVSALPGRMAWRSTHLVAFVALAAASLLTSCGSSGGGEPGAPGPSSAPTATAASTASSEPSPTGTGNAAELTIVVDDGTGEKTTWRLTCAPDGGDHPDPKAACSALQSNGERSLPPVPEDRMCTEVYGGPATATITGTWRGSPVQSRLSLVNGCEIARWTGLAGLLPEAAGGR